MLDSFFRSALMILTEAVDAVGSVVEVTPEIAAATSQAVAAQDPRSIDWSLVIAIAALVFSVASPIASAWITGHFQLKQKQLEFKNAQELRDREFYVQHRAEVIERFLHTAGAAIYDASVPVRTAYGESVAEIYLYLPKKYWGTLENLEFFISHENSEGAMQELTELASKLSEEHIRFERHEEPKGAKKNKIDQVASK